MLLMLASTRVENLKNSSAFCSSSMRWATFGDAFWYADNLAAMAKNGYSGLCRQDYIGADCA